MLLNIAPNRPPKILKSVGPTRSGGLPCSNLEFLIEKRVALKIALAPTTCAFRDGSGDGSGWIGAERVFANSHWRP